MNKFNYPLIILILILSIIISCTKQEFTSQTNKVSDFADNVTTTETNYCSLFTLVKPPVDFLFVWDNSASRNNINSFTKNLLGQTINNVSESFDYHILVAPIIPVYLGGNPAKFIIASDKSSLSLSAVEEAQFIDSSNIQGRLDAIDSLPTATGSQEHTYERVKNLIETNISNGVFRQGSHLIVVVMSNEDEDGDITSESYTGGPRPNLLNRVETYKNHYKTIKQNLNSLQFRFMTMVPHEVNGTTCPNLSFPLGAVSYRKMSERVYADINGGVLTDQNNRLTKDSYNICNDDFMSVYSGINAAIQQQVLAHVYDYWPIAPSNADINTSSIELKKMSNNQVIKTLVSGTEFIYQGILNNKNTRYLPTPGEPYTGHMVKLEGAGIVTHPECLVVKYSSTTEFFGYIVLPKEPDLSTINLRVDGQSYNEVSTSSGNGWMYRGFVQDQNTRIGSRAYPKASSLPAVNRTGYVIELFGNAIYSSGQSINVNYKPKEN